MFSDIVTLTKGTQALNLKNSRDDNLILTALAIGRVPLLNATKSLEFVLAQVVLTLTWASGRVLISNPVIQAELFKFCHFGSKKVA